LTRKPPEHIGRYRLIRRIGRGGSGEVHLARLEAVGGVRRLAAVKILFHTADDPRHHEALLAEARLGALLCHPNIAQVLDAGVDNGLSWFAMEFVPGLSFYELLEAGVGQIPPWIAARLVADACSAVHALHEATDEMGRALNVVHRDVTPHNLLVSWDGNVKLVDLGVAHSVLRGSVTKTGVVKGKLGYMSPEQASGAAVDRRCDVFALGVQLWEALAGRRLFRLQNDSETLAAIVRGDVPPLHQMPGVPRPLAEVVAGALAMDPTSRIPTALEMQRALEVAFGGGGIVIGPGDVAHFLAHIAPDRVREHVRWLSEAQDPGDGPAAGERALTLSAPTNGSVSSRWRRRSSRFAFPAVVAVLAAATGLVMSRSAADRSPPAQVETIPPAFAVNRATAIVVEPPVRRDPEPPPAEILTVRKPAPVRPATRRASRTSVGVGTLYLSASPTWATINLDGKMAGTTPTVFSDLRAGAHVVLAFPLGKGPPIQRNVVVEAGETARIGFDFEEP
jgi:serine/threonine protein kinase